jgi:hypothetical protein
LPESGEKFLSLREKTKVPGIKDKNPSKKKKTSSLLRPGIKAARAIRPRVTKSSRLLRINSIASPEDFFEELLKALKVNRVLFNKREVTFKLSSVTAAPKRVTIE